MVLVDKVNTIFDLTSNYFQGLKTKLKIGKLDIYLNAVLVILIFTILLVVYGYNLTGRLKYRNIPGMFGNFLFGIIPIRRKIGEYKFYDIFREKFGDNFVVWFGRRPVLYTSDLDLYKKVGLLLNRSLLTTPYKQSDKELRADTAQGNLFSCQSERWHDVRAISQPPFNANAVRKYDKSISRCIQAAMDLIEYQAQKKECINALQTTRDITLPVIMETGFGLIVDVRNSKYRNNLEQIGVMSNVLVSPVSSRIRALMFFIPTVVPEVVWFIKRILGIPAYKYTSFPYPKLGEMVLDQWKQENKEINFNDTENGGISEKDKLNGNSKTKSPFKNMPNWKDKEGVGLYAKLIQQGLVNGQRLEKEALLSNIQLMIVAGHDTTATTLAMALYEISKNKDVEARIIKEVDSLGSHKEVTADDVDKLPYVQAVVKEALRLYPAGVSAQRMVEDQDIKYKDLTIPIGTLVRISITSVQRSEKYWPQPSKFIPERFLGDSEYAAKHPNAWIPFGYGPRMCIGWRLAMMESIMSIAAIYKKFTFKLSDSLVGKQIEMTAPVNIIKPTVDIELFP